MVLCEGQTSLNTFLVKTYVITSLLFSVCLICKKAYSERLIDCRHLAICMTCAEGIKNCPLCQERIGERRQIFWHVWIDFFHTVSYCFILDGYDVICCSFLLIFLWRLEQLMCTWYYIHIIELWLAYILNFSMMMYTTIYR